MSPTVNCKSHIKITLYLFAKPNRNRNPVVYWQWTNFAIYRKSHLERFSIKHFRELTSLWLDWPRVGLLANCLVTVFKAVHGIYCYQHSIRTTACMATNMHTAVISFYHLDTLSNLQAEVFNEVWPHNNVYLSVQGHGLHVYGEQSLSISFTSLYHPSTTLFTNQCRSKISEIAFPPAQRSGQTDNINLWCYKCH